MVYKRKDLPPGLSAEHDSICAYLCADATKERLAKFLLERHFPTGTAPALQCWPEAEVIDKRRKIIGYIDVAAMLSFLDGEKLVRRRVLFEVKSGSFSHSSVLRQLKYYGQEQVLVSVWAYDPKLAAAHDHPALNYFVAPSLDEGIAAALKQEGVYSLTVGDNYKQWRELYCVEAVPEI